MDPYTKHYTNGSTPTSSGSSAARRTFGGIKILKYFLLSTLLLLLIGTLTLTVRLFLENTTSNRDRISSSETKDKFTIRLLTNYLCIFLVTGVAIIATVKEHFFFLVTSASINLSLSFVSVTVFAIEWTIALLQIFTSLLTFTYLLSVYLKMKIEIQRRRKLDRLRQLQNHFIRHNLNAQKSGSSIYSSSNASEHQYDKINFTSKWILNQQSVQSQEFLKSPNPSLRSQ